MLERLGEGSTAERHFESANALEPDHSPLPASVDGDFFRVAVAEALDNLPRSIREYVDDVPVLVEDYPSDELISLEGVSPQILGLYIGTPRTEAGPTHQPLDVTRVILFKRNLEKICRDATELPFAELAGRRTFDQRRSEADDTTDAGLRFTHQRLHGDYAAEAVADDIDRIGSESGDKFDETVDVLGESARDRAVGKCRGRKSLAAQT